MHQFGGTAVFGSSGVLIAPVTKQTLVSAPNASAFGDAPGEGNQSFCQAFLEKRGISAFVSAPCNGLFIIEQLGQ